MNPDFCLPLRIGIRREGIPLIVWTFTPKYFIVCALMTKIML
jgi:hypothetical protein